MFQSEDSGVLEEFHEEIKEKESEIAEREKEIEAKRERIQECNRQVALLLGPVVIS